jgi:hypothetical protein
VEVTSPGQENLRDLLDILARFFEQSRLQPIESLRPNTILRPSLGEQ